MFWSGVSGVLRRHADFWVHLALAAAAGTLWFGGMEASVYLAYAFAADAAMVIDVVGWLLGAVLMFLLLANALHIATSVRHPLLAALGATIGAYALMVLQDYSELADFTPQPKPMTVLRAPFAKLRDGVDYEAFDAGGAGLFASPPEDD